MPQTLPVIIDTDPGVDDALALLFAAASPELDVLAVTTVAGNVKLEVATENARRILPIAWGDRTPPRLYRGETGGTETAEFVHGWDGLGGVAGRTGEGGTLAYPPLAPVERIGAVEALLTHARSRPGEITLITLGPLTNLAAALREDAEAVARFREIVIMGGAFREPGNTSALAEFNIFADPESAQTVCEAGLPLRWVPLDVTHRCLFRPEDLTRLPDTPRARFLRDITEFYMQYHVSGFGEEACFLHDPIAVASVVWPELVPSVPQRVNVEAFGQFTRGMTVADFRPCLDLPAITPNGQICLSIRADLMVERICARLA